MSELFTELARFFGKQEKRVGTRGVVSLKL
jgi:hypothetical protein